MKTPELIVTNADICTMDPLAPRVAALAVTNGRVSALGTAAEIAALAGPSTRIIDAGGRLVLPGFQDTHIHLQDSGYDHSKSASASQRAPPSPSCKRSWPTSPKPTQAPG